MSTAHKIFKFIMFLVFSLLVIWVLNWVIGWLFIELVNLSKFWMIVSILFGGSLIVGMIGSVFGFLASLIVKLNTYPKAGFTIIAILSILFSVVNIIGFWTTYSTNYTMNLIAAIAMTFIQLFMAASLVFMLSKNID